MLTYGLIGRSLSHSFSRAYFQKKFSKENIKAEYLNFELSNIGEFEHLIKTTALNGLNVTIPFKTEIIPYLDEIDTLAQRIGAVNTIKFDQNRLIGYNTDYWGFKTSLENFLKDRKIENALILGSGGASKAVKTGLEDLKIPFKTVSRSGKLNYSNLTSELLAKSYLIINTTPLGTYPNTKLFPDIDYGAIGGNHLLFDLVYNPDMSRFLEKGRLQGAKFKNGMEMLIAQAERSWDIWNK